VHTRARAHTHTHTHTHTNTHTNTHTCTSVATWLSFFPKEFLAVEWFSLQRIHTQAIIATVTISSSFHPYPSFSAHDSYFGFALNGKTTRPSFTANKISTFWGRSLCRAGFVRVFWEDLFKRWCFYHILWLALKSGYWLVFNTSLNFCLPSASEILD